MKTVIYAAIVLAVMLLGGWAMVTGATVTPEMGSWLVWASLLGVGFLAAGWLVRDNRQQMRMERKAMLQRIGRQERQHAKEQAEMMVYNDD